MCMLECFYVVVCPQVQVLQEAQRRYQSPGVEVRNGHGLSNVDAGKWRSSARANAFKSRAISTAPWHLIFQKKMILQPTFVCFP